MKRFALMILVMAVVSFGLAGCGKNSTTAPKTDPVGAQAEVDAGNAALANGDYAAANQHYKNALDKNPNNTQASFGAAATEVYLVQDDPDVQSVVNQFMGASPAPARAARTAGARKGSLASRLSTLRTQGVGGRFTPLATGHATFRMLAAAGDPSSISEVQAIIRAKVMPRLQYAETRLDAIENAADFSMILSPAVTGAPDPIEIDKTEVYVLDGVVNNVEGWLGLLVAYNFDVPNNDYNNVQLEPLLAADSPWATLHTGGAQQLAAALANLHNIKLKFDAAVTYLSNETDDQSDDLIPKAWLETQDYTDVKQGIDQIDAALSGPVSVSVTDAASQPFQLDVNIMRFFTPAIADLKTKLPDYTITNNQLQVNNPIVLTDPTINGIFPDMTNDRWRTLTGLTGPPPPLARLR